MSTTLTLIIAGIVLLALLFWAAWAAGKSKGRSDKLKEDLEKQSDLNKNYAKNFSSHRGFNDLVDRLRGDKF